MTDINKLISFLQEAQSKGVKTVSFYRVSSSSGLDFYISEFPVAIWDALINDSNMELFIEPIK